MLVHTMTPEEINREIYRDYEILSDTTMKRLGKEYDSQRSKKKIDKTLDYPVITEIKTKAKNKWIIIFHKASGRPVYKSSSDINYFGLVYYSTPRGLRVFKVSTGKKIVVYNAHVFTRYNERLNLGIPKILDQVKHFFVYNGYASYSGVQGTGRLHSIGVIADGYLLGEGLDAFNWILNRTFIRKDQAFIEQEEIEAENLNALKADLSEILRKNPDNDTISFYQNIIAGITSKPKLSQ